MPKPVSDTEYQYIERKEDLTKLIETLSTCDVIGIDLEVVIVRTKILTNVAFNYIG